MLKRASLILATMVMSFGLLMPAAVVSAQSQSQAKQNICEGLGSGPNCDQPAGDRSVNDIIKLVVNILSVLVAVTAVLVIMFAGFRYVTSMGDSSKISSAKDTIIYAIVGLIVAALAQVIVRFVLGRI